MRWLQVGDIEGLLKTLAPGVVRTTDGGGFVNAARRPLFGADNVARFLLDVIAKSVEPWCVEPATLNGQLGALVWVADDLDSLVTLVVANDHVTAIYAVSNPSKLAGVAPRRLTTR